MKRKGSSVVKELKDSTTKDEEGARPFLKWVGGKRQLLPELLALVPTNFDRYFEPFLGGGALFFALRPRKARLSDVNLELINCYQVVQDNTEPLIESLKGYTYSELEYYRVRGLDRAVNFERTSAVKRASRFIFLNKTGFNGLNRVNRKGQSNVPFGRYKNPKICDEKNLQLCSEVLRTAEILPLSFEKAVESAKKGDFVYFDPPYIPLSKSSSFTGYSKQLFGPEMQIALRDVCRILNSRGVKFLLSNSSSPLIKELYGEFNMKQVNCNRSVNSVASSRGPVKESLVWN